MKKLLAAMSALIIQSCSLLTYADTPPQVINKTCSANQFFNKIAPGTGNITCLQPTYSGISNTPTFTDSVQISSNIVTLVNDLLNPGNSKFYGTDSGGVRGFYDVPVAASSVGTIDSQTASANGGTIATNSLYFQSASVSNPGLVNNTTQSFSGNKTFTGTVGASNLSGTNTGDVTLGAVGSTPNANGASLSGQVLTLQPADGTNPGSLTAGAQSIGGAKTFTGAISASNLSSTNTGDISIGTADGLSLVGQVLSLALSSTSTTGALSSTDWNTFNNKAVSGNYITALTGDVVATGPGSVSSTIQSNVVSNAKLAQMAANTIKGNNTAGLANAADLTVSQTNTLLGDVTTLGAVGAVPNANGASISGNTLNLQPADGSNPGALTAGTQTIGGNKTFTGTVGASNLSGTNSGDVTIGTANGLSLVGQALSLGLSSTSTTGALSSTDWNTFNGKQAAGNYITALTGDATASGPGSAALTLATVNSNVGSFGSSTAIPSFTVNGKGLVTAASTNAVIAPAGTLTGTTLASNVVTSSLTTVGTIGTGAWQGTAIADGFLATSYIKADGTRALTGNWGAGAFSGTFNSVAVGSSANTITGANSVTAAADMVVGTTSANKLDLKTNSALGIDIDTSGRVGVGSNAGSSGYLFIGNQSATAGATTGANQQGAAVDFTASSAATTGAQGVDSFVRTPNTSFTAGVISNFKADTISKGAASTITRSIQYEASGDLTVGTNNAIISDNEAFTGNWALNLASTNSSKFSGPLTSKGVTDASNAATGFVGEILSASNGGVNVGPTTQFNDVTHVDLTAGDWDLSVNAECYQNGATVTVVGLGIGTASGNSSTGQVAGINFHTVAPPTAAYNSAVTIASYRVSISGTTTYYLKDYAEYSAGTPQCRGLISGRRMR